LLYPVIPSEANRSEAKQIGAKRSKSERSEANRSEAKQIGAKRSKSERSEDLRSRGISGNSPRC
ncbi:MAG TPA: hypothetical protein VFH95_00085, partial [Candidatus Kapabacteria bacterium]|nr:hypothetical protein [Candidatus Kapabacteria bacterium]